MKEKIKQAGKVIVKNELIDRARAKTPRFWKRIQLVGGSIAALGLLITAAPISIPAGLAAWGTYLTTVGGTMTGLGQFAKE